MKRWRVAILFDPGRWRHRGTMRGITRFMREQGGWDLLLLRYHTFPTALANLSRAADGAITDASTISMQMLGRSRLPRVALTLHPSFKHTPMVTHDFAAAGQRVAEAMIERGFRHLRSFTTGEAYRLDAKESVAGFAARALAADPSYEQFFEGPRTRRRGRWVLEDQISDLADWLDAQPRPLGLLAVDDEHAWRAARAADAAGLRVPDDVAIAGIGNDVYLCDSINPTLSSVNLHHARVGYLAAQTLLALMEGRTPEAVGRVPPLGLVLRQSTDVFAVEDPTVRSALELMWAEHDQHWSVEQIAEQLLVSKRTLHRRFLATLGRPPGEEIRRARVERARRLITTTDLLLVEIAVRTGYSSVSQLSRDIHRHTGLRPTRLRERARQM